MANQYFRINYTPITGASSASNIQYDNSTSGLAADNVQDAIDEVDSNLDQEIADRTTADNTLQDNIDAEEAARIAADDVLQDNIDSEQAARIAADALLIPLAQKGQPNGVASLDGSGLVPASQLPSYVDDVLEFPDLASFPVTGETGKIYVALDTNKVYRWSGSAYIEINQQAVTSVFGRTGAVVAVPGDYTASQVTNVPSGNLAAVEVQAALNELQTDIDTRALNSDLTAHINDTVDAHDASAISNIPSGNLAATDMQGAVNELQTDIDTVTSGLSAHLADTVDAHDASAISVVPAGNLAATEVQAALVEHQGDIDTVNAYLATFPYAQVKYVDKAHVGTYVETGDFNTPYKTLAAAMTAITDATASKKYVLVLAPGVYTEANTLVLKPFVNLFSYNSEAVTLRKLDNTAIVSDLTTSGSRIFYNGITFTHGLTLNRTAGAGGANAQLYNCDFGGTVTYSGRGAGSDFADVRNCIFSNLTINAITFLMMGGLITGNYTAGTTGGVSANGNGWMTFASVENTETVNVIVTAATGHTGYVSFLRSTLGNTLNISTAGTGQAIFAGDSVSYPYAASQITQSGNVTLGRYTTAYMVEYIPTVSGNWLTQPDNILDALDILSARVAASVETAQDAVGTILTDTNTIDFTYSDATPSIIADVRTQLSLTSDASGVKLVNDASTPGNTKYYGTNGSGVKGFFDIPAVGAVGDIQETSFSYANNQVAAANVTGFAFSNAVVRSFKAIVSVVNDATADSFEEFSIEGIQRGSDWVITSESTGDDSGVEFSITTAGQIQYTSTNTSGFTLGTMKFRAWVTSV